MIAVLLGAMLAVAPVRADTVRDTVFVVSNRRREGGRFTRDATDSLWYGVYEIQVVIASGMERALARIQLTRVDSLTMDAAMWRSRLKAAATDTSAAHAVLVYVHGYASSPATAVAQAVQVKARGAHLGPLVVYLWPTHGRYVAMPTPTRAYHDDGERAAVSGGGLARTLRVVDSIAPGAVLIAHSMGVRVALDALLADFWFAAHPLRALGIFSPDVGAQRFRRDFAPQLPSIAHRIAMYGASTDYLLGASSLVNRARRASGIAFRGPPLAGIELVDDTRGARAEPRLLAFFGPRHAVRWASAALEDFFRIVVTDAPPACRVSAGTAVAVSDGRWKLTRNPHDTVRNVGPCGRTGQK
jgi:hypothetical protein